jgi:hypothetical protein
MFIQCRNREWSSAARAFTLPMAASIVTASKCAPIMQGPTSSENGATAAARPAITFSSGRCFLGKCAWARTWRMSGRARQPKRKAPHPVEPQAPQPRLRCRGALPQRPLLSLGQVQLLQLRPAHHPQAHHLREQLDRLRRLALLKQPPDRRQRLRLHHRKRALLRHRH